MLYFLVGASYLCIKSFKLFFFVSNSKYRTGYLMLGNAWCLIVNLVLLLHIEIGTQGLI